MIKKLLSKFFTRRQGFKIGDRVKLRREYDYHAIGVDVDDLDFDKTHRIKFSDGEWHKIGMRPDYTFHENALVRAGWWR